MAMTSIEGNDNLFSTNSNGRPSIKCRWCGHNPLNPDAIVCSSCQLHQSWIGFFRATGLPAVLGLLVSVFAAGIAVHQAIATSADSKVAEQAVAEAREAAAAARQTQLELDNTKGVLSRTQIEHVLDRAVAVMSELTANRCLYGERNIDCRILVNRSYDHFFRVVDLYVGNIQYMSDTDQRYISTQVCFVHQQLSAYSDGYSINITRISDTLSYCGVISNSGAIPVNR